MTTPNLSLPELAASQSQPHVPINSALRRLDGLVQLSVIDRALNTPPGSPADGDCYILGAAPTGAWSTFDEHDLVIYIGTSWVRYAPLDGWLAYVQDEDKFYHYNADSPAEWTELATGGASPTTTLGDLIRRGASADERLGVGTNGQVLTVVSGQPAWAAASGGSTEAVTGDTPPETANAKDDEFDDDSFDTALWTDQSAGYGAGSATRTESRGAVIFELAGGANNQIVYTQSISGTWKFRGKVVISAARDDWHQTPNAYVFGGLVAIRTTGTKMSAHTIRTNNTNWQVDVVEFNGATYFADTSYTVYALSDGVMSADGIYLELEYDGTNLITRFSFTGREGTFFQADSRTSASFLGGSPDLIGFIAGNFNASRDHIVSFEWFRRIS